jgi:hypothetical protein
VAIDVWEPKKTIEVDEVLLRKLLSGFEQVTDQQNLAAELDVELVSSGALLMKLESAAFDIAETLPDADLESLIRFFTLAEMQLPGWEAGKQNPVIYLVKIIKARGTFDPTLRRWIKSNSDNRYLPYGSAL